MTSSARRPVTMAHPARWLAVIRIVIGLYFGKAMVTKLTITMAGGFLPLPAVQDRWLKVMPAIVAKQAEGNPIIFYKEFLEGTVLAHSGLFAHLTAWGEMVAGVGLTLGLLSGVASLVGLALVINYGLATQWMSPAQFGFHLVLTTLMVTFFLARVGRTWGLDARLAARNPESILARRPFS